MQAHTVATAWKQGGSVVTVSIHGAHANYKVYAPSARVAYVDCACGIIIITHLKYIPRLIRSLHHFCPSLVYHAEPLHFLRQLLHNKKVDDVSTLSHDYVQMTQRRVYVRGNQC